MAASTWISVGHTGLVTVPHLSAAGTADTQVPRLTTTCSWTDVTLRANQTGTLAAAVATSHPTTGRPHVEASTVTVRQIVIVDVAVCLGVGLVRALVLYDGGTQTNTK